MREHLGEFYDKTSDFQQNQFNTLMEVAAKAMPMDEPTALIDIGCGTGSRTLQCFDHFKNLTSAVGIEPDPDMFYIAQSSYADPRVTYQKIAGEDIPSMEGYNFNLALSNRTLHWLEHWKKEKMMEGLNSVMPSGSWFMFNTCERPPAILQTINDYIKSELRLPGDAKPFSHLDAQGWTSLLNQYGWDATEVMTCVWNRESPSADEYVKHLFTSSTTRFMYGRHLVELSHLAYSDLLMLLEATYPAEGHPRKLAVSEDSIFVIARKR